MGHEEPGRRSFLAWATMGLGALFTAIVGAPVVAYIADPRNRKGTGGDFRTVDMAPLADLQKDRPVQGVLRAVRRDGWTLHPNDVIGRVWVILKKDAIPASFHGTDPTLLSVFTTTCPHLGCSINLNANHATGFTCPCHTAQYALDGARIEPSPAARGMDSLEWKIESDPANPDRQALFVKFQNFKATLADKVPV